MGNPRILSLSTDTSPDVYKFPFQIGFVSLAKGKWYVCEEKSNQSVRKYQGKNVLETSSCVPSAVNFLGLCQWRVSHCLAGVEGRQTGKCGDVLFCKVNASGTQALCPEFLFCFPGIEENSITLHFLCKKRVFTSHLPQRCLLRNRQ